LGRNFNVSSENVARMLFGNMKKKKKKKKKDSSYSKALAKIEVYQSRHHYV